MRIRTPELAERELQLLCNELSLNGRRCEALIDDERYYTEIEVDYRLFFQIDLDRIREAGVDEWGFTVSLLGRDQTNGVAFEAFIAQVSLRHLVLDVVNGWYRTYAEEQMGLLRDEEALETEEQNWLEANQR